MPDFSGFMGALGAALYAKQKSSGESSVISKEALEEFSYTSRSAQCGGCTAKCGLNIITFGDGKKFISGNRCEKGAGKAVNSSTENLYDFKYDTMLKMTENKINNPKLRVGLPLALNFYELLPFWKALFDRVGIETVISQESSRDIYYKGEHTIP